MKVTRHPRYVDEDLCSGCLECIEACVYKQAKVPDDFNMGLSKRRPIYIPFPQAVPQVPVVDPETCIQFKSGKCKTTCIAACGDRHAINLRAEAKEEQIEVGTVILATGFQTFDAQPHSVLRLRQISQRLHRARGGTPGERLRPHRRRSSAARRPAAANGGDRPLRRLAR